MAKVCIYIDPKIQQSKLSARKLIHMNEEMLKRKKMKSAEINGLPEIRRRESRGPEKSYREIGSDQSEEEQEVIPKKRKRDRKNSSDVEGDISKILSTLNGKSDGENEEESDFNAAEMDENFDENNDDFDEDDDEVDDEPLLSRNKKNKNKPNKQSMKNNAPREPSPSKGPPPKKAAKRDETVYECGKCKLIFISLEKCNAHMKDVHGVPMVSVNETFICTHSGCNFKCGDAETLKTHTNTVHSPVSSPHAPRLPVAKSPVR